MDKIKTKELLEDLIADCDIKGTRTRIPVKLYMRITKALEQLEK